MIKYVELTAPEASAYRQAKILSFECNEGDSVKTGDTLFIVQSGGSQLELPATKDGRIIEFIVTEQESITLSTPLLLLETEVDGSTASKPLADEQDALESRSEDQAAQVSDKKAKTKRAEQQSLDLSAGEIDAQQGAGNDAQLKSKPSNSSKTQSSDKKPAKTKIQPQASTEKTAMSDVITITVPDIGADSAKVIEILVNEGDEIAAEDAVVTLESDKASMDVPSPHAGTVKSIEISLDDDVSEGSVLIKLESNGADQDEGEKSSSQDKDSSSENKKPSNQTEDQDKSDSSNNDDSDSADKGDKSSTIEVKIPDIGGDSAKVVEILMSEGDEVQIEDALITLESDKASMDVPSSDAGTIERIHVDIDDDVSEGTLVVTLKGKSSSNSSNSKSDKSAKNESEAKSSSDDNANGNSQAKEGSSTSTSSKDQKSELSDSSHASNANSHASPSIRRFARELGVDLSKVDGSGRKNRITKDDVKSFVKGAMSKPTSGQSGSVSAASDGAGIPAVPAQDFSKFGEIDVQPLNKIKRLTAQNLHRSWLNVPHVTHHDESNINDLEAFRKQLNAEYQKQQKDIKLSPLAFIVKAVVNALQTYPQFNSSLEPGGENLIYKKYFHIGIAVDTPNGLVVPVIRDADQKSVADIAVEMGDLAKKARDKKLTMNEMSGACFSISSLGGIGGTSFTPIVNAPEVAILGVSRSKMQPVWNGNDFEPGMILPLSLSYDHRVIDGAEAARFTRHVASILEDIRRLAL